ncbi:hypothetical protein [Nitrococcus mobilis]|uniref:A protein n=1 Tax=Nitrococcus mobilis Nb-231 TaxID=314278 RepID=A4BNS7_9GAMM|nr:hypothetical protein [Nitrococcus mobilis]EAR22876.1 A protein [Nitrococcus mobilis Nb-231]
MSVTFVQSNTSRATIYLLSRPDYPGVDNHGIDSDLYGRDTKESSKRVTARASLWGIRQLQQIGGSPVTMWRQLSRLMELKGIDQDPGLALVEKAREAADSGG